MNDQEILKQVFWGNTLLQYILFGSIIILGLLLKRIISRFFSQLLFKVFKKFADDVNMETFIALLIKPIEFFISVATAYLAINQLSQPMQLVIRNYEKIVDKVKVPYVFTVGDLLDKVFLFLIILSVFWIILRIVDFVAHVWMFRAAKTHNKADDQLVPFLKELFKFIIIFIGFFVLLGYVFEVNAVSLITGLGIGGIAIAMAAKESLENLLGSFLIFMDKPFTVGDVVRVDGVEGVVEKVGFRSTVLRSLDKTILVIPNRSMIDGVLENLTRRNYRRVKFNVGIVYETPVDKIKTIIYEMEAYFNENKNTSDANVSFDTFADSSLNIQILYLIEDPDFAKFQKIKEEVNFKIIEIVQRHGSDFAYPTQRTIGEMPMAVPQVANPTKP